MLGNLYRFNNFFIRFYFCGCNNALMEFLQNISPRPHGDYAQRGSVRSTVGLGVIAGKQSIESFH